MDQDTIYKYGTLDSLKGMISRSLIMALRYDGRIWRYRLHLDTVYKDNSWAIVEVWTATGWAEVLRQDGLEADVVEHWHLHVNDVERRAMQRSAQWTPHAVDEALALIRRLARLLAE